MLELIESYLILWILFSSL